MQVLPGVVGGVRPLRIRRLAGAAAAAVALLALAGCARFDAALGQRQAVVTFTTSATKAQKLNVRSACATVPNVTPQAVPSSGSSPYALQELTFEIDHASDANVAQLEKCLNRFPAVVAGVTLQDSSDDS
jgi:hypothetical protein